MDAPLETAAAVLATLRSRRSVPAQWLTAPGPNAEQLEQALQVALCAPDHGALRPWRFVLIRGAARERLAELFVRRMLERDAAVPPGKLEKARQRALRAPLIIGVGAQLTDHPKVPAQEQLLSSAAAVMNLLNAFHAQGFGAIWLTGDNAYDRQVAEQLGFTAAEHCLGFVYVGSIDAAYTAPPARRVAREAIVREWAG